MMEIETTRFGTVVVSRDELLEFPNGLIGMGECRRWALCADERTNRVGWLQSADFADVAVGVVDPRSLVPNYRVRCALPEVASLAGKSLARLQVLVTICRDQHGRGVTANLKAPLVVDLDRRIGAQVVCRDDFPIQHVLSVLPANLRRSA